MKSAPSTKRVFRYVGNFKDNPIFIDIEKPSFMQVENSMQVSELKPEGVMGRGKFMYYGDCGIASFDLQKNEVAYKASNSSITKFLTPAEVVSITVSEDCNFIAYSTYDSVTIVHKVNKVLSISGAFPQLIQNKLYYTKPSVSGDGFVDLYRFDLSGKSQNNQELLVIKDVFEDGIFVFPNAHFVACQISIDGIPTKVVYSLDQHRFAKISDSVIQDNNYYPMVHSMNGVFFYYTPENLKIRRIKFPEPSDFVVKK